jgi:integrase/recombinase XerD
VTPHTFRPTYITEAIEEGAPVHIVQESVGHASADTTNRYNHQKYNPDQDPTHILAGRIKRSNGNYLAGDPMSRSQPPV